MEIQHWFKAGKTHNVLTQFWRAPLDNSTQRAEAREESAAALAACVVRLSSGPLSIAAAASPRAHPNIFFSQTRNTSHHQFSGPQSLGAPQRSPRCRQRTAVDFSRCAALHDPVHQGAYLALLFAAVLCSAACLCAPVPAGELA